MHQARPLQTDANLPPCRGKWKLMIRALIFRDLAVLYLPRACQYISGLFPSSCTICLYRLSPLQDEAIYVCMSTGRGHDGVRATKRWEATKTLVRGGQDTLSGYHFAIVHARLYRPSGPVSPVNVRLPFPSISISDATGLEANSTNEVLTLASSVK